MNIASIDYGVATIVATFLGPILAVGAAEWVRYRSDTKQRRVHIFRTLMATRSTTLSPHQVEAINLVEMEFHDEARVVEAHRAYRRHLDNASMESTAWERTRQSLQHDLLWAISQVLSYPFTKDDIARGTYYPGAYYSAEQENAALRKHLLQILTGKALVPVVVHQPSEVQPKASGLGS